MILILLLMPGCNPSGTPQPTAEGLKTARREFGPIVITVEVSPEHPTVGDAIDCRFIVDAEPAVTLVKSPSMTDNPGAFAVIDYTPPKIESLADGKVRTTSWFKLDPTLPGTYLVPPQELRFIDGRPGQDKSVERRTETPELRIEIRGLVSGDAKWSDLKQLRDRRRKPLKISWPWVIGALAIGIAAWMLYRRHVGRRPAAPPEPAHILAEREITRLLRENLIDQGKIELFVERLSDILRRYIERRFDLRAPERTTEEFYEELQTARALTPEQKEAVVTFLRQADVIKFADGVMERDQAVSLLDTVRLFIEQTRMENAPARRNYRVPNLS